MTSLPRVEFGYERTVCDCDQCRNFCHKSPGYLIPADISRLHRATDPFMPLDAWVDRHLLASQGPVCPSADHTGTFASVGRHPLLVVGRKEDGTCLFLNSQGYCDVHADSPYGCAFFNPHESHPWADFGARAVAGFEATRLGRNPDYHRHWLRLYQAGRRDFDAERLCGRDPPFRPTSVAEMRTRLPEAIKTRRELCIPMEFAPESVFDFENGLRLYVFEMDMLSWASQVPGAGLAHHVSTVFGAAIETDSELSKMTQDNWKVAVQTFLELTEDYGPFAVHPSPAQIGRYMFFMTVRKDDDG